MSLVLPSLLAMPCVGFAINVPLLSLNACMVHAAIAMPKATPIKDFEKMCVNFARDMLAARS
jgi:hypothetical protein